jgi:hypothetical protein
MAAPVRYLSDAAPYDGYCFVVGTIVFMGMFGRPYARRDMMS